MKIRAIVGAALLVLAAVEPVQARAPVPLVDPPPVTFATNAVPDASAFKAVLVRAGAAHNWVLQSEQRNVYTMSVVVRNKHTVNVDVTYGDKGYSIAYASSINMNYAEKGGGTPSMVPGAMPSYPAASASRVIHPNYMVWVDQLNRAIQLELTKVGTK